MTFRTPHSSFAGLEKAQITLLNDVQILFVLTLTVVYNCERFGPPQGDIHVDSPTATGMHYVNHFELHLCRSCAI